MTHYIVVGLGFGDEGKGRTVDYLCSREEIKAVVRFSGGAQAAHNVVTPDGRHHTFAQFGSGTFHQVPTYLSPYMLVNLYNLWNEYEALLNKVSFDPMDIHFIHEHAPLITPYHRYANRLREKKRGAQRHGSCGQGIGETQSMMLDGLVLRMSDLVSVRRAEYILSKIRNTYVDEFGIEFLNGVESPEKIARDFVTYDRYLNKYDDKHFEKLLDSGSVVFEGSQGALLDEWNGFHPYTTWSTTTPHNAKVLLQGYDYKVIGVTRSYMTRHGDGPMPSRIDGNTVMEMWPEPHNTFNDFQGGFHRGALDLVLLRYAATVCGEIDEICVTHLDRPYPTVIQTYWDDDTLRAPSAPLGEERLLELSDRTAILRDIYIHSRGLGSAEVRDEAHLLELISDAIGAPVTITCHGPTYEETRVLQLRD